MKCYAEFNEVVQSTFEESCEKSQELILSHLGFAERLARRFYYDKRIIGVEYDDLCGAAYLGLCDAARRYDEHKGVTFCTYSYLRIRGAMYDLLRRNTRIFEYDEQEQNGTDKIIELDSEALKEAVTDLAKLVQRVEVYLSSCPDDEIADENLVERKNPESTVVEEHYGAYVRRIVEDLPEPDRFVLQKRYFEGLSMMEIGEQLDGIKPSWLSRIHVRALEQVRKRIHADDGRDRARQNTWGR